MIRDTYVVSDTQGLHQVAEKLLEKHPCPKIFAFFGEMGAGKTTFIKELCALLGVTDAVTSPTFSIINEYRRQNGNSVFHFDFYRINSYQELYDLGYEEYLFGDSCCFIEWPEKAGELLPDDSVYVEIKWNKEDNSRVFCF